MRRTVTSQFIKKYPRHCRLIRPFVKTNGSQVRQKATGKGESNRNKTPKSSNLAPSTKLYQIKLN
jgi:hypothetical protein